MDELDIRCGFLVDEDRKKLWSIELKLYEDFRKICEKYNLSYFFIGGAAIGAVRHQGFIPWDDDLDIGMPRRDFEKLLKVKDEFALDSVLEYGLNENCTEFYHFCRIRDLNSTGYIKEQYKKHGNHGVFIELYPFDNVPVSRKFRKVQWILSIGLIKLISYRVYRMPVGKKTRILSSLLSFVSTKKLYAMWLYIVNYFNGKKTKMVDTVSIPNYSPSEVDFFFAEDISSTVVVPFENTVARVPVGNDQCLRKAYGDYMQFPPEEERGTNHNTKVFYDPNKKFTEYTMEFLDNYFGES